MKNKIYLIIVAILMFSCKDTNQLQAHKHTEPSVLAETKKTHATINAEIVFCLDATGSMGGLIGTAKEKIWDIVSELAQDGDIDTLKWVWSFTVTVAIVLSPNKLP